MQSNIIKVAGVTFERRQEALSRLKTYPSEQIHIQLEREKDNPYDANAIKVMVSVNNSRSYHLGYIPAKIAKYMAIIIDSGTQLTANLKKISKNNCYSASIEIINNCA